MITSLKRGSVIALLFLQVGALQMASADPTPERPPGPPPELVESCKGKEIGDRCALVFGGRPVEGFCGKGRNDILMCRPGGKPAEPPAEMFAACEEKEEREACVAPIEGHEVPGHCTKGRGNRLLCRPGPWRLGE